MTSTITTPEQSDKPGGCSCPAAAARDALPPAMLSRLRERFSQRRTAYITSVLTVGELSVIAEPADALIIARIKRMSDQQLNHFERLEPANTEDRRLYAALQCSWLRDEEYLLSTRLGRQPTHGELFADFMRNHNGLRFRAYFALKFPKRMKPTRCKQTA